MDDGCMKDGWMDSWMDDGVRGKSHMLVFVQIKPHMCAVVYK